MSSAKLWGVAIPRDRSCCSFFIWSSSSWMHCWSRMHQGYRVLKWENHRTNWWIPLPCLIAKGNLYESMVIFHFVMAPKWTHQRVSVWDSKFGLWVQLPSSPSFLPDFPCFPFTWSTGTSRNRASSSNCPLCRPSVLFGFLACQGTCLSHVWQLWKP